MSGWAFRAGRWGFLALVLATIAGSQLRADGGAGFKHSRWTAEQSAPRNVVDIAQTPDGYLWVATAEGLFRFDGLTFEPIPVPPTPGFESAIPMVLFVDRSGRLWVGFNQGAGVATYQDGHLVAVPMPRPPPAILNFAQSADGAIWAAWGGGGERLFRWAEGQWAVMDQALALPPGEIASVIVTPDNSLWVSLGSSRGIGSLARLEEGAPRFQAMPDQVGFTRLALDRDGALWVSDQRSTRMIRDARGQQAASMPSYPAVPGSAVPPLAFDHQGGIWGTTRGVGLFRIARGEIEQWSAGPRLSSDATIIPFVDREGSIWVATDAGLDRYRAAVVNRAPTIPADVQDGLEMAQSADGSAFVAAAQDLYRIASGEAPVRVAAGLGRVAAICPSDGGGVWVAHRGRMTRFAGPAASVPLPADPLAPTNCVEDAAGRLWINGRGAIWYRDAGDWQRHPVDLRGHDALDLVRDPIGDGILIHTGGDELIRLAPGAARVIGAGEIGVGTISALYSADGAAFASGATGIARIARHGIHRISSTHNPWAVGVRGMAVDPAGDAWLLARLGIARVPSAELARGLAEGDTAVRHRLFDALDGYDTRSQASSFRGAQAAAISDGRLVFATRAGVMVVEPGRIARNTLPPPVAIRTLVAGERIWRDPPAAVALPAGTRNLRIAFAVNSLAVPARNQARYRLEGQDEDWVTAGSSREASYTNVGPGRYVFRVIAANADGVWNETGATVTVDIPPTFFESWTFRLLCAAAIGAIIWIAYLVRLRFVARRMRSRLLDRLRERERVARDIHDTLLQSIQALMLRFQMAADALPPDHQARRELEDAMDRADEVVAEGRDRLKDLRRTGALEDPEAALRELAGRQLAGTGIIPAVRSSGTRRPIDVAAWDELASIAAEAMFNAARHSHASMMEVEIDYRARALTLRIADDGVGIPAPVARDGRRGHYGIPGMRERAARIGGTLRIRPRREGGTELSVTIPAEMVYRTGGVTS